MQEAKAHCDAWPECQAIVFGPQGLSDAVGVNMTASVVGFKGAGHSGFIDMRRSSLTPLFVTYVKAGQLAAAEGASSEDSGISKGAIAGKGIGLNIAF